MTSTDYAERYAATLDAIQRIVEASVGGCPCWHPDLAEYGPLCGYHQILQLLEAEPT